MGWDTGTLIMFEADRKQCTVSTPAQLSWLCGGLLLLLLLMFSSPDTHLAPI